MTKDTNENNTQSSSFRDQILRELEELKTNRAITQSEEVALDKREEVIEELKPLVQNSQTLDVKHETVKVGGVVFPSSYLVEEPEKQEEVKVEEPVSNAVEKVEEPVTTVSQDTVERNLEELRNLVAANTVDSDEKTSPSVQQEQSSVNESSLEDTFLEFPTEDVSAVTGDTEILTLDETLVVSALPTKAGAVEEKKQPVQSRKTSLQKNSKQRRREQDKTAKRIVSVIMSVVVVAVLITGITGFIWIKSSLAPIDTKATESVQVEIPEGSTTLDIGKILVENKLIKNATVFNYYSKIKSYNNFQSGFYNLKQSMSVDDIAKALQESGTPTAQKEPAGKILIVEGYTLTQISQAITNNAQTEDANDKTPFASEEFMATVTNQDFINRMVAAYPQLFASLPAADSGVIYQLEGYLFPAVYEYTEETTMEELVEQMIAAMDARLQPYYETIASKNLSVNEVLTLASLVEKEGSTDEDRRNIASVFFNRINSEMPLQSNIAILYAQGKLGQETTLAEDAGIDTSIESPYNIYWRTGLMPGPVDSPSVSAIDAVINANTTDYLFFVADVTTGTVYYAQTREEHDQNVAQYVNAHLE